MYRSLDSTLWMMRLVLHKLNRKRYIIQIDVGGMEESE